MKNIILSIIGMFFLTITMAQTKAIKIINIESGKELIIKENKRVKLVTTDGNELNGRFSVKNDQTIIIDGTTITLSDIDALKRNSLFLSIFTSSALIYSGAITVGLGAIIGVFAESSGFFMAIPGAAMITTGILSPNLHKNHKKVKGWSFEIVTLTS